VHPPAVGPAPHFVAWLDLVSAPPTDLAGRVRLVVVVRVRRERIRAGVMFFRHDAEFLLYAFLDLGAPEVRRSCHPGPFAGFERA
jgi:hypothetical protein